MPHIHLPDVGIATAILNPINTAIQIWVALGVAWERDVINGDTRSRVVSLFCVKGLDKLG